MEDQGIVNIFDKCNNNIKDAIWELDIKFNNIVIKKDWKVYMRNLINIMVVDSGMFYCSINQTRFINRFFRQNTKSRQMIR